MSMKERAERIKANVPKVYEAGKRAEYDAFWDAFQASDRQSYARMFNEWKPSIFYPKYDIVPLSDCERLFNNWKDKDASELDLRARLEECGVTLDLSHATRFEKLFAYSAFTVLPTVDLSGFLYSSDTYSNSMFQCCRRLKTIEKLIVNPLVWYTNAFEQCYALEDLTVEGEIGNSIDLHWSKELTPKSVEAVIKALSGSVTGKTLTLDRRVKERLLKKIEDEAEDEGTKKAEEIAKKYWERLVASKSNWTIALV